MLRSINVFPVFVLAMLSLDLYGQTKDDGPYLRSPNVVKAAGTWVGVYGDLNFKMNLRVRQRYIANANYSTDLLEGNYAFGNDKINGLGLDTAVVNIWDGHFFDQQKQNNIVFRFRDTLKNKEVRMVLKPIAGDNNAYQMSLSDSTLLTAVSAATQLYQHLVT